MQRLGILGGTFDPIHYAHLFIAEEARVRYELDRVLFVPNGVPAHKPAYAISCAEDRLAMVRLATAGNPSFEVSTLELDRPGPSYTADTLAALQDENPDAELFFISGVDAIAEVETWMRPRDVLRLCTFIAVARRGYPIGRLEKALSPEFMARVLPLPVTPLATSATEIRRRVLAGLPIRYLTPDPVVDHIASRHLYRPRGCR